MSNYPVFDITWYTRLISKQLLVNAFKMNFDDIKYCQYLISSQKNYILTNLAHYLEKISHHQINQSLFEKCCSRGRNFVGKCQGRNCQF